MDEHREDEGAEDLDVSQAESEDVKGGALNAYIANPVGEKQGKFAGSVSFKSAGGLKSESE